LGPNQIKNEIDRLFHEGIGSLKSDACVREVKIDYSQQVSEKEIRVDGGKSSALCDFVCIVPVREHTPHEFLVRIAESAEPRTAA
jgi:hypothetical protein